MKKRVLLTVEIEWTGACPEDTWGFMVAKLIEESDRSRLTKVVEIKKLTNHGLTDRVEVG